MEKIKINDIVENILSNDERCRNSDLFLIIKVCHEFGLPLKIDWSRFNEYPSFESITRVRRKLNEKNMYLPNQKLLDRRRELSIEYSNIALKDKPISMIE